MDAANVEHGNKMGMCGSSRTSQLKPTSDVQTQMYQTVQGLSYLHGEGIAHGDLHAVSHFVELTE